MRSTTVARFTRPGSALIQVGYATFKDGSVARHTIPVKIGGKSYLVMIDEGGSSGLALDPTAYAAGIQASCSAGLSPFPMARIYDISNEANPTPVSKLMLGTHDPANCTTVLPDTTGLAIFTYGSHYCSVTIENMSLRSHVVISILAFAFSTFATLPVPRNRLLQSRRLDHRERRFQSCCFRSMESRGPIGAMPAWTSTISAAY